MCCGQMQHDTCKAVNVAGFVYLLNGLANHECKSNSVNTDSSPLELW